VCGAAERFTLLQIPTPRFFLQSAGSGVKKGGFGAGASAVKKKPYSPLGRTH